MLLLILRQLSFLAIELVLNVFYSRLELEKWAFSNPCTSYRTKCLPTGKQNSGRADFIPRSDSTELRSTHESMIKYALARRESTMYQELGTGTENSGSSAKWESKLSAKNKPLRISLFNNNKICIIPICKEADRYEASKFQMRGICHSLAHWQLAIHAVSI